MSKTEHILTVSGGHGAGRLAPPLGVTRLAGGLSAAVIGNTWFGPRPHLETLQPVANENADAGGIAYPEHLQLIPYTLFRYNGQYLRYLRTTTGGDERLHGKISVGIGGHVGLQDAVIAADGSIDVKATLDKAFRRETREEIALELSKDGPQWHATLYWNATEVDSVHFGIVGIYDLTDDEHQQIVANHEVGDIRFATLENIADEAVDGVTLENWTRLVIEASPLT